MHIIEIESMDNGAHRNQTVSDVLPVPPGWAVIPDDMTIPDTYPFVSIEVDGQIVTSMTAGAVPGPDIETARAEKNAAMSAACNAAITGGVDVELSDGVTYHYSLTLEDQLNMMNLQAMVASGSESVPYHADGEECRYYSAAEFSAIAEAATAWKLYHESYFNSLRSYIRSMTTVEEIEAATYGMEIPAEYQTDVLRDMIGGTA